MATKRGKSQARRHSGNSRGLPGWAWLVLGVVLTMAVVLEAPKWLKSGPGDGFFRPKANPDAQPATASGADGDDSSPAIGDAVVRTTPKAPDTTKATKYDFYTMLPGDEVVMSDAELAATAREEAARKAQAQKTAPASDLAKTAPIPIAVASAPNATPPHAVLPSATTAIATTPAAAVDSATRPVRDAPYILQAGAFGASGDAEAIKARVALLGLSARVESAAIKGKTVYRVRMGPYATASELAEAKRKLASGGLPALAIKAK